MVHLIDDIGLPIDPALRRLEFSLGRIAGRWRGARGDAQAQARIAEEYRLTLLHLYELGWDAELHPEALLPDRFMPEEFYQHNPAYRP